MQTLYLDTASVFKASFWLAPIEPIEMVRMQRFYDSVTVITSIPSSFAVHIKKLNELQVAPEP